MMTGLRKSPCTSTVHRRRSYKLRPTVGATQRRFVVERRRHVAVQARLFSWHMQWHSRAIQILEMYDDMHRPRAMHMSRSALLHRDTSMEVLHALHACQRTPRVCALEAVPVNELWNQIFDETRDGDKCKWLTFPPRSKTSLTDVSNICIHR